MSVGSLQVKVCGMTDPDRAQLALELGADFIGMIHHASSPRHVELGEMQKLCRDLPRGRRVGVVVQPSKERLTQLWDTGVDLLQVHLKQWDAETLDQLQSVMPRGKAYWLAPKLRPQVDFPVEILAYASKIVLDTYEPNQEGGTGKTGDWGAFQALQIRYPTEHFVLAGGLNASNVVDGIVTSGAGVIDVNSGVECAPGVKSPVLLREFFDVLRSYKRV